MKKNKKITWAPVAPLIGGFPLAAESIIGVPPTNVYSFPGFLGNDSQYLNYQESIKNNKLNYVLLDGKTHPNETVDISVHTCPCAALSQLNTGGTKNKNMKGSDAVQNEWMYLAAEETLKYLKPKVLMGENAPALFTIKGKSVANKLKSIAFDHGYSFSMYKTSTHFHGIPQRRDRTFYCMWDSEHAPVLDWYKKSFIPFGQYLDEIKEGDLQQDIIINSSVQSEPYFDFIKKTKCNDSSIKAREEIIKYANTALGYINKHKLIDESLEWFKKTNNEKGIKISEHTKKKFSAGLGVWDGSVHVFGDKMNAVISRNLTDTIHPTQDRSLTIREAFHMMGFPKDFELVGGRKNLNLIAQNVPVCTASSMVEQAVKFINGELPSSGSRYVKQNNWNESIEIEKNAVDISSFI